MLNSEQEMSSWTLHLARTIVGIKYIMEGSILLLASMITSIVLSSRGIDTAICCISNGIKTIQRRITYSLSDREAEFPELF